MLVSLLAAAYALPGPPESRVQPAESGSVQMTLDCPAAAVAVHLSNTGDSARSYELEVTARHYLVSYVASQQPVCQERVSVAARSEITTTCAVDEKAGRGATYLNVHARPVNGSLRGDITGVCHPPGFSAETSVSRAISLLGVVTGGLGMAAGLHAWFAARQGSGLRREN